MLLKHGANPNPALFHLTVNCKYGLARLNDDHFCKAVIDLVRAGGDLNAAPPGGPNTGLQNLVEAVFDEWEDVNRPIYRLIFDPFEVKSLECPNFLARACLKGRSALASFFLSRGFSVDDGIWAKIPIKERYPALKLLIRLYTAAGTDSLPLGKPGDDLHAHLMSIRRIARLPADRTQPESFHGLIECAVCTNDIDSLLFFVNSTDGDPIYCGHYICKTCYPKILKKECPLCRATSLDAVEMAIYGTHRPLCAYKGCSEKTVLHYCKAFQLVYPSEYCTDPEHKKVDEKDPEPKTAEEKAREQKKADEKALAHPVLSEIVTSDKADHVERYKKSKECTRCHRTRRNSYRGYPKIRTRTN